MDIRNIRTTCLVLTMALLASQNAMALKVYQWTDEEGQVHFSDTPPPGGTAPSAINEIEMVDSAGNNTDADKYSIVNQLEQMTAWRRQEEADQRAWKQLQLEEERLAQEQQSYQPSADISTNTYLFPAYYPRASYYSYLVNFPRYTHGHGHRFPDNHLSIGVKGQHGKFTAGFGIKVTE